MTERSATCRSLTAGHGRLVVTFFAFGLAQGACAGDTSAPPAGRPSHEDFDAASAPQMLTPQLAVLEPLFTTAVMPDDEIQQASSDSAAPAQELAAGLDVRVDHKRREFRSDAVSWMTQRSLAMGRMTDLLLGGADTGWHVVVDPTGADEYILEWKIRFR